LQTQVEGLVQVVPSLSPGEQIGGCPVTQVTLHGVQGGGPSTVQEDGIVRFQAGVAVAEGIAVGLLLAPWALGLADSAWTGEGGESTISEIIESEESRKIEIASNFSFIGYFCLLFSSRHASHHQRRPMAVLKRRHSCWSGMHDASPCQECASSTTKDSYPSEIFAEVWTDIFADIWAGNLREISGKSPKRSQARPARKSPPEIWSSHR
jgi:hypothetical protein